MSISSFRIYLVLVLVTAIHSFISPSLEQNVYYLIKPQAFLSIRPKTQWKVYANNQINDVEELNGEKQGRREKREKNILMDDFRTAEGELIEPYKILKVSRNASQGEIKKAYRDLSKKYHPDGARHRKILPGSCNNESDIRAEWERINLSYRILSRRKTRKKYDRNSSINEPHKAVGWAAMNSIGWAVSGISKTILDAAFKTENEKNVRGK